MTPASDEPVVDPTPTGPPRRTERRTRLLLGTGAAFVAVLALVGVTRVVTAHADTPPPRPSVGLATTTVERGSMQGTVTAQGALDYAGTRVLPAGGDGIVTALPPAGSVVRRGGPLVSVNDSPARLLYGSLPAWRAFEPGMTNGPDVRQLERNLRALGYFRGKPDQHFSYWTGAAIRQWQAKAGEPRTGSIPFGKVVFAPGRVRVASTKVAVGDAVSASSPALEVTSLDHVITANLKQADGALVEVGSHVVVDLPEGGSAQGRIETIGAATETTDPSGGKQTVVPVSVALDRAAAVEELDRATVTLHVTTPGKHDVLHVPVEALIATDGTHFAVQAVSPDGQSHQVAVTTGEFATGQVEISGDGVREGLVVVVPS